MQSGSLYNQLILEFLGKPYAKGASGPDAYDCYSFCRAFAERVGLPLPDLGHLDPEKAGAVNEQSQGQFERLSYARPWSLVTFREDKPFATHCGIVLPKDDLFIHCNRKSGVVCEPLHHRHWQPSIEGYYWPRDIIEVVVLLSPIHNEDKMWLFTPRSKRTLGDILNNEQFVALNIPLRAFLDGKEVLPQDWPSTSLQAVRQIVLRPQLSGGGDKRRGVAIMMLTFAFTAIGAAAFGPALATGAIGAIEYGILMAGTQMAAGFALNAMIPPKKPERLAGADAYAWSPHTTQEAGTPIDRIYGKVPVYGNLIMGYTVPSNAMDGYSPWHQLIWDLPASGILTSEHTIYSKVGYGDGPIKGVVDGSVRLNDVDPTEFEGFAISHFRGTNSQSAASFGDRVQYQPTFKELSTSESQTFTLPDKDVTGIAVIIGSPEGINTTAHSQKILPGRVKIKIEMRAVGGSWHTLMDGRLAAKSAQWLREIYYNDETYEGGSAFTVSRGTQYEIRVTRVSDKSSDRRGQIYLEAVQGIYNDGFTYPGLAYSALSGVATSDINSRLQFRAVVEGRILQVWKGSYWTFEYNNNPAWVIFDLLTRPVIKGDYPPTPYEAEFYRGIDPSWIDVDAFYALAQWCDEMVDDGKGGTEKRFTFNGVFNSTDTAWNQVLRVASMCRAYPYFNGRKVTLWIDKPATPVQVFTVGNIVSGEYEETWFGHEGRISEWQCSILDENQDYRRSPVTIRDTSVARRVIEKLAPIGVTRQSQLWRMVAHLEEVNKLMSRSVTFPADLDAIYSTLGGVIYLQHDITNVNQGGRITVVAGMTITVDFTPQDEGGGYSVLVRTADETNGENLKLYTVSSISGQEITVTAESWTYTPQANDVVMYGTTSQINDLYRIRSMRRTPDGRVAITAQVYDENYYGTDSLEPITSTMRALQSPNASVVPRDEQITWKRLQQTYPEATVYGPGASGIYSLDLSWSGNGTDQVTWAGTDEFDKGTICIRGDDYVIAGGSTTKKYVYFDTEAGDTTVMQTSDSEADLLPAGRYLWCINKNGTPYLKQGVEVGKDASIINLDDAAMGASYRKEFEENFEDTFGDVEDQWTEYGSAGLEIISTGGVAGGKFLRVGDNSGNDQAEVVRYNRIPYDPTAMYRVRVRVKQQAGSGTTYVGVACRNKADTAWVYIDGSDSNHGAHWIVLNDVALDGEWTVYTGYVHGTSDSPSHGQFSDPNNPGQLHSDVGYIMPFFACNTSYEAGEFDIDFFCIDVMPESTDQIASSALYSKEFHEYFQNPIQDVEVRWPSYSGSGELSVVTGGVSGGKFLRAGDDSGNDEARLIYYRSIPFDPSFLYRIRCRVRRNSGAGKCYLGIAGRNGADDAWVNISGADLISAQHYLAAYDQGPTSSWTEFTGYLKGSAATGTASEAHNPAAPGHLHEDARWFRPMIVVNYDSQAGQYDIDEFSVDVIPDQVGSVQLSVLDYGAVGGQDCTEAFQLGSNARSKTTASTCQWSPRTAVGSTSIAARF